MVKSCPIPLRTPLLTIALALKKSAKGINATGEKIDKQEKIHADRT